MGVEMARDGTPFFSNSFLKSFALTSGVGNAGLLSLGSGQMVTSRSGSINGGTLIAGWFISFMFP